jgi:hypothetical protein
LREESEHKMKQTVDRAGLTIELVDCGNAPVGRSPAPLSVPLKGVTTLSYSLLLSLSSISDLFVHRLLII